MLTPQLTGVKITQPCLFITGEHDLVASFSRGGLEGQKAGLAKVCQHLVGHHIIRAVDGNPTKTACHWIQQERPEEVNELLLKFLDRVKNHFGDDSGLHAKL